MKVYDVKTGIWSYEPDPVYPDPEPEPELTPAEQREQAYNTEPCVPW